MLGDLPERLVPFEFTTTRKRFQGKDSIYHTLQKFPLKPWKSLAYQRLTFVIEMIRALFKKMIVFPCILFTSFQNLHAAFVKKLKDKIPHKNKNIFFNTKI